MTTEFKRQLRKIGSSLSITIPKEIVLQLDLQEGEFADFAVRKILDNTYWCSRCCMKITSPEINIEDVYCPICGLEYPDIEKSMSC
jgi:hypothetical protein